MTMPKNGTFKTPTKEKDRATRLSKKAQLIRMLTCKSGTDVPTVSKKLGWQHHTTRAALTGLRKAGYEIVAAKMDYGKPTRYRIKSGSAPASFEETGVAADAG